MQTGQRREQVVKRNHVAVVTELKRHFIGQLTTLPSAAALQRADFAGVVYQNSSHHGRADGKEVRLALPTNTRLIDHSHISLVDQRGRTEAMAHRLVL